MFRPTQRGGGGLESGSTQMATGIQVPTYLFMFYVIGACACGDIGPQPTAELRLDQAARPTYMCACVCVVRSFCSWRCVHLLVHELHRYLHSQVWPACMCVTATDLSNTACGSERPGTYKRLPMRGCHDQAGAGCPTRTARTGRRGDTAARWPAGARVYTWVCVPSPCAPPSSAAAYPNLRALMVLLHASW